jgi:hypothetical protein
MKAIVKTQRLSSQWPHLSLACKVMLPQVTQVDHMLVEGNVPTGSNDYSNWVFVSVSCTLMCKSEISITRWTNFDATLFPWSKKVAACAKHYVGDGGTYMGINANNTIIDTHGLMSIHMRAYYNSIIRGVSTIMVSYSSWNGEKMHANHFLITDFLKNKLKFRVSC